MVQANNPNVRKLTKWFAARGLEVKVAMAEGPAGRPLTTDELQVIEQAAHRLSAFEDGPDIPPTTPYPANYYPRTPSDPYPYPGASKDLAAPIQYGPMAKMAAAFPAGKPDDPADKKALAAADWEKRRPQVLKALDEVFTEVKRSLDKHGGFRSGHEGWAVLQEEVDELWDEIKADNSGGIEARNEAKQVAAMGVKYMVYIAGNNR